MEQCVRRRLEAWNVGSASILRLQYHGSGPIVKDNHAVSATKQPGAMFGAKSPFATLLRGSTLSRVSMIAILSSFCPYESITVRLLSLPILSHQTEHFPNTFTPARDW